jgi:hypothetical protein
VSLKVAFALLSLSLSFGVNSSAYADEGDNLQPVTGSVSRMEVLEGNEGDAYYLRVFSSENECQNLTDQFGEDYRDCMPIVDPGNGNVRLAVQVVGGRDNSPLPLPLRVSDETYTVNPHRYIKVSHGVDDVRDGEENQGVERHVEIVPHGEVSGNQLFVLLIDRSPSMNANDGGRLTRMEKTQRALLMDSVVDGFFGGRNNRVLMLTFSNDVRGLGSGTGYELVSDRGRYRDLVGQLSTGGTQTRLYESIGTVVDQVLTHGDVTSFTSSGTGVYAQVTVVVLTDGFNWTSSSDTCGSNTRELVRLLRRLKSLSEEANPATIYTVGLGTEAITGFPWIQQGEDLVLYDDQVRAYLDQPPTPSTLCGSLADSYIDPSSGAGLEDAGIDNASLAWIAHVGGGDTYVRRGARQLAEAFEGAAAKRYEWFELRYHTDPTYFNQSFETELHLQAFADASARVMFYPPAWFGLPEATTTDEDWMGEPTPLRATLGFVIPVVGLAISLVFVGSASFNLRRGLTRSRPKDPPQAS